jgi:asparagine synthase (glutamine-hydrolysing)
MCGIIAISGKNISCEDLHFDEMLSSLQFRGPDDQGQCSFDSCILGHRRLSIIDIDGGLQPMSDGTTAIAFNGEVYNYRELRSQLEKLGHSFKTNSDTEVVLKAYQEWGHDAPIHLDGMFAFIIWNDTSKEFFMARDRFGKKPLFYYLDKDRIFVASEIKSLLASRKIKPVIDYSAIDHYLKRMYIPPNKSVYSNISQLAPGHYGVYSNFNLKTSRYWSLPVGDKLSISYEEAKDEVHRLLKKAVEKRVVTSDVRVGSFLSGGLDSSLTTILTAEILEGDLDTFSVDYKGDYSELKYAQEISSKLKGVHHHVSAEESDLKELGKVIEYFDEPHADTSDFPQSLVSKLASENVKLVMSGDGADETFFGYKWHVGAGVSSKEEHDLLERRVFDICVFSEEERVRLWSGKSWGTDLVDTQLVKDSGDDLLYEISKFDLTSHLPGQILTKVDRMGMMHGLEVRSPFLDTELVNFAFKLPHEFKLGPNMEQKYILRDILAGYTSKEFAFRKKQGFGAPIKRWMLNREIKSHVDKLLDKNANIRTVLNGDEIDKHISNFYLAPDEAPRNAQKLWVLICLEKWFVSQNKYVK